jgi:hypothetical protein|tara:strand:- start:871 stop:1035 length:165 start_codon:yes stop_codon:yes gene_type:complete
MDLPINDEELAMIVNSINPDSELFEKLNIIMEIRQDNPGGPYKKIAREKFGFVI